MFFRVSAFALEVVPTWPTKSRNGAVNVTTGAGATVPVADKATACGEPCALSVTVKEVWVRPA